MHRAVYTERIEVQEHKNDWLITRVITAFWKGHALDVYKEYDNGECFERNIYSSCYSGRVIAFPGEPYSQERYSYYGNDKAVLEDWQECNRMHFYTERTHIIELESDKIIALYPDFKYVLKKWENPSTSKVMEILPIWKKHNEVEFLLALGFEKIVTNKSFYKLKPENKKKIIKWIQKNPEAKDFTLRQIQTVIKNNIDIETYFSYLVFLNKIPINNCSYKTYEYLHKNNYDNVEDYRLYNDYICLARQANHNLKEDYWLYPKHLHEEHAKVLNEVNEINKTKYAKERAEIEQSLSEVTNKASKFNTQIDGYSIFVTNNMEIWNRQAQKLHQCIIRCNYMKKVADRDCIIVFIQKEGVPVATAEILKGMKIGQFYADEISYSAETSRPTKEVQNAFEKYFARLPKKLFKKEKVVENA